MLNTARSLHSLSNFDKMQIKWKKITKINNSFTFSIISRFVGCEFELLQINNQYSVSSASFAAIFIL